MENASKALIMAGGVLIGVLVISLAVYLFIDFGNTSARLHDETEIQRVVQFNSQFTAYENKAGLTIYDIITVAGYARENNKYYEESNAYESDYKIDIYIGNTNLSNLIKDDAFEKKKQELIKNDTSEITKETTLPTYSCTVNAYHDNGRVARLDFKKNN